MSGLVAKRGSVEGGDGCGAIARERDKDRGVDLG